MITARPQLQIALGVRGLSDLPELTNSALDVARWNPEVGCLIDRVYPGRPLILSFGFIDWSRLPNFDFFGRTKKLEMRTGTVFNRILVRDIENAWYHRGVPGLGSHVDEVASALRGLIHSIRPCRVVAIGQSMGGYAAIMFGMLLDVERIVAFGPLSHLDPSKAAIDGDRRFLPVMEALQADPPKSGYFDLVRLGQALGYRGELHIVFGTHPGDDDGASGNLDAIHALRLARLPGVSLYPCPGSQHAVVQWLIDRHQIDDLLAGFLMDDEVSDGRGAAATTTLAAAGTT